MKNEKSSWSIASHTRTPPFMQETGVAAQSSNTLISLQAICTLLTL